MCVSAWVCVCVWCVTRLCVKSMGVSWPSLFLHPTSPTGKAEGLHLVRFDIPEASDRLRSLGSSPGIRSKQSRSDNAELHSKSAKVRQEAHDQAPLDPGGVHVDALRHEDEVWGEVVKEKVPLSAMLRLGSSLGRDRLQKRAKRT